MLPKARFVPRESPPAGTGCKMHRCCRASSKSNGLRIFTDPRISHLGAPSGSRLSPTFEVSCGSAGLPSDLVAALPKSFPLPDFQLGDVGSLRLEWPPSWNLSCSATISDQMETEIAGRLPNHPSAPGGGRTADGSVPCVPGQSDREKLVSWRTFHSKRWLRPTSTGPHRTAGCERTAEVEVLCQLCHFKMRFSLARTCVSSMATWDNTWRP